MIDANKILALLDVAVRDRLFSEPKLDREYARCGFKISPEWTVITFYLEVDGYRRLEAEDHNPFDTVIRLVKREVYSGLSEVAIIFEDLILCLAEPYAPEGHELYGKVSEEKVDVQAEKIATMLIEELTP